MDKYIPEIIMKLWLSGVEIAGFFNLVSTVNR